MYWRKHEESDYLTHRISPDTRYAKAKQPASLPPPAREFDSNSLERLPLDFALKGTGFIGDCVPGVDRPADKSRDVKLRLDRIADIAALVAAPPRPRPPFASWAATVLPSPDDSSFSSVETMSTLR